MGFSYVIYNIIIIIIIIYDNLIIIHFFYLYIAYTPVEITLTARLYTLKHNLDVTIIMLPNKEQPETEDDSKYYMNKNKNKIKIKIKILISFFISILFISTYSCTM